MSTPASPIRGSKKAPVWIPPPENDALKQQIIADFHLHPVVAQVLVSRGFSSMERIHQYLYGTLPDLHNPFLLEQMEQAVERLARALDQEENVLIYGDNDVDGMSGTALLVEFLRDLGFNALFFVSQRNQFRKEPLIESISYAKDNNCSLLITVDCGITATKEIALLVQEGVDVIVTDHHEVTETIPACTAILNPKLPGSQYPNRDITGVGVAFKLAHGFLTFLTNEGLLPNTKIDLKKYLDLVLLGTISDMGSLNDTENRIFVRYGLKQLKKGRRIGLVQLLELAAIAPADVSTFIVASQLTPRLNSLGRIANPEKGVEILLVQEQKRAQQLAVELDLNNLERQKNRTHHVFRYGVHDRGESGAPGRPSRDHGIRVRTVASGRIAHLFHTPSSRLPPTSGHHSRQGRCGQGVHSLDQGTPFTPLTERTRRFTDELRGS